MMRPPTTIRRPTSSKVTPNTGPNTGKRTSSITAVVTSATDAELELVVPTASKRGSSSEGGAFETQFAAFQQQVLEDQRARASAKEAESKLRRRKTVSKSISVDSTALLEPQPPSTAKPTTAAKRSTTMKLEQLAGAIAPTRQPNTGGLQYDLPGHSQMATAHIYNKACRQYARRIEAFRITDAVRRIQLWYRRVIIVKRSIRQLVSETHVVILVRRLARSWLRRARATILARTEAEKEKTTLAPLLVESSIAIQAWWRGWCSRRTLAVMRRRTVEIEAQIAMQQRRFHAARLIQSIWRMTVQRRRTRLARSSLKNFRVGRVIHQVRWYFFRRSREAVRKTVEEREQWAAGVIQRSWKRLRLMQRRRYDEFLSKTFPRVASTK